MELGERLKEKRLEMGLTVRQVADIIGVNVNSIYNWEAGKGIQGKYQELVEDFLDTDIEVPVIGREYEPLPEAEEKPAAASKPKEALKSESKKAEPAPATLKYEVITNNRERIQVKAETVKFAGDKGWVCFSIRDRLVATFRTSEILGVREV